MAKELMDENQQPPTICSTRGGGRKDESRKLDRVGAGESSASTATDTNTYFKTLSTKKQTVSDIIYIYIKAHLIIQPDSSVVRACAR